jgi:hypothetical protein
MSTYSSAPAVAAFDTNASQPLGALSTGMGYAFDNPVGSTTASTYIGGAAQSIGYGHGVSAELAKPSKKQETK